MSIIPNYEALHFLSYVMHKVMNATEYLELIGIHILLIMQIQTVVFWVELRPINYRSSVWY
jgi:hypothetical protein